MSTGELLLNAVTDLSKAVSWLVGSVFFFCLGLAVVTVRYVRKTK